MFTGLIEEIGVIKAVEKKGEHAVLNIRAEKMAKELEYGESVCVNGVCLTVKAYDDKAFKVDVMPETMRMSMLKKLQSGDSVNLERALKMNSRLGGHLVTGHVDGVATLERIRKEGNATLLIMRVEQGLMKNIVYKGSVCLDGVSLTVSDIDPKGFTVSIIPTTKEETTLLRRIKGDELNVECDIVAKYLHKLLISELIPGKEQFDLNFLKENGFL